MQQRTDQATFDMTNMMLCDDGYPMLRGTLLGICTVKCAGVRVFRGSVLSVTVLGSVRMFGVTEHTGSF